MNEAILNWTSAGDSVNRDYSSRIRNGWRQWIGTPNIEILRIDEAYSFYPDYRKYLEIQYLER